MSYKAQAVVRLRLCSVCCGLSKTATHLLFFLVAVRGRAPLRVLHFTCRQNRQWLLYNENGFPELLVETDFKKNAIYQHFPHLVTMPDKHILCKTSRKEGERRQHCQLYCSSNFARRWCIAVHFVYYCAFSFIKNTSEAQQTSSMEFH